MKNFYYLMVIYVAFWLSAIILSFLLKNIMSSDFDNKPLHSSANNIYKNKLQFKIKNGYPLKSLVS